MEALSLNEAAPLKVGDSFLDMQVTALLGQGGSAWVYRVHEPLAGLDYALKLLPYSGSSEEARRTRKEFLILREIDHPNVVRVVRAGVTSEQRFIYIQMELALGLSLREVLHALPGFSVPEILRLGVQLCDAANAAHQNQVVHRDLKPENVMIGPENTVKVFDFGVAKLLNRKASTTTDKNHWVGTPFYMSPEQLLGQGASPASDVYAIGVMLDEMARGQHFIRAASETATQMSTIGWLQVTKTPPALHTVVAGFPRAVSDVIRKAMAKELSERFQTALELRSALVALEQTWGKERAVLERDLVAEATEVRHPSSDWHEPQSELVALKTTRKVDVFSLFGTTLRNEMLAIRNTLSGRWDPHLFFEPTIKSGPAPGRFRFGMGESNRARFAQGLSAAAVLVGLGLSGAWAANGDTPFRHEARAADVPTTLLAGRVDPTLPKFSQPAARSPKLVSAKSSMVDSTVVAPAQPASPPVELLRPHSAGTAVGLSHAQRPALPPTQPESGWLTVTDGLAAVAAPKKLSLVPAQPPRKVARKAPPAPPTLKRAPEAAQSSRFVFLPESGI